MLPAHVLPASSRPRLLGPNGRSLLLATPSLVPTMEPLPASAAPQLGANHTSALPAFGLHSAFHSPVLGPAPSSGVSMFGLTSASHGPSSMSSAPPSFHLTSSPQLQAFREGNSLDEDVYSFSSSASTDFGSSRLLNDSPEAELDGWFGFDPMISEQQQANRARALLGSGEISVDIPDDDLSSTPELHLLKVISRANSVQPQQQEESIFGTHAGDCSPVIDLTVSSPSSVASLPLLQSPIYHQVVPLSPPMFTLTPSLPALHRSQSESSFTSNQPMYTPSPRMTGSLSKFRPQQAFALGQQVAPPSSETILVATSLPPPQPKQLANVVVSTVQSIKKVVSPSVEIRTFGRLDSLPSTPVPVGAQWKYLSSRPALSAHCMQHFEVLDEVKHQVLERLASLASGAMDSSSRDLSSTVCSLFEDFRVRVTQLYIRRAKAQALLDEKARKAGITVVKEESSTVHWALTIPPISLSRQPSSSCAASSLGPIQEQLTVKVEQGGEKQGVEGQDEDAEVARLLPQGDDRMDLCQTPVKQEGEESFIGRHPPPLIRRAQSVHIYRQPSPSVCRRLPFDRSSTSSSRPRTFTPSSYRNRQSPSNAPLTAWFKANQVDPYPSPEEKEKLCQATGLNMDQLAHWFINARMRQWDPAMKEQYKRRSASSQLVQEMDFDMAPADSGAAGSESSTAAAAAALSSFTSLLSSTPSKRRKLSNSSEDAEQDAEMIDGAQVKVEGAGGSMLDVQLQAESDDAPMDAVESSALVAKQPSKKAKKRTRY